MPFQGRMHPEDGGSMDLCNVGILPQHYTMSNIFSRFVFEIRFSLPQGSWNL